ncbi:MAG: hypothetical protein AB7G23_20415 [Vicinamibacterales bacterium]
MATYERPETIFGFITADFENVWDSVAAARNGHGVNYALALHAMILLEWAARLCAADGSGKALADFNKELEAIEPRYFTKLPGRCCKTKEFVLPHRVSAEDELLGMLFDLLRNGHGHQYQQMIAHLDGGGDLVLGVAKVVGGWRLADIEAADDRSGHLVLNRLGPDLRVQVRPDLLFLDVRRAISRARLTDRGLNFEHLERTSGKFYPFGVAGLEQALRDGGLSEPPA